MNDNYYHYRIEINNSGDIYVAKQTGKLEYLYRGQNNPAVNPANENIITVNRISNVFYLFINGSFIKEFRGIKPEGTHIGFNVGVKSEIVSEYIRISYLEKKTGQPVAESIVAEDTREKDKTDEQKAQAQAAVVIPAVLPAGPPEITWTSPSAERVNVTEYTIRAKAAVKSTSKLVQVRFYLDDIAVGESEFIPSPGETGRYLVDKIINLKPGENAVYFLATNEKGESTRSPMRYFINPETTPPVLGWMVPAESSSTINTEEVIIEGIIKSPSGISSTMILVNGLPQAEENRYQAGTEG
ncbi:hypothetical protein EG832_17035, partial [bacterium]|nr:hypothetical protein [bacterium]